MHRLAGIILTVALLVGAGQACAQSIPSGHPDTTQVPVDSEFHMTKSPLEAVLLSAALPGAGQVYLHQTWKVPIIYALAGGFLYGALIQNFRYHEMIDSINARQALGDTADILYAQHFVGPREFYRNDRDKWWIYLGLAYIANVLDAYVSANLYDFDVSTPGSSPFESYYDPIERRGGISLILHF
jgi:hypothetical protein